MTARPAGVEWGLAVTEAAVVILSGVAVYRLLGGGAAGVTALLITSGAVAALWALVLNPWNRWGIRRLTRAWALAALAVLTSIALVMTGLFWWAAALMAGAVLLVLSPALRPDRRTERRPDRRTDLGRRARG